MSFKTMTRRELIDALRRVNIISPFFEENPTDVISSCKYHTLREEVEAGCYTFQIFVEAYKELTDKAKEVVFGEIQSLATQTFAKAVSNKLPEVVLA